ncbi:hypothetical protein KAS14_04495 [Candidatus Bathyarchaeota archaeon]|nr:hypothetical protein [Candidatus Bathyarchaeota archaeon]
MNKNNGAYLVILEFPEEKEGDPNLDWVQNYRQEVEYFCDRNCFKIGTFYILPEPYFPVIDRFLREANKDYREKGYRPTFKVLKANFPEIEYTILRGLILNRVFMKLEKCLNSLDGEIRIKNSVSLNLIQGVSGDLAKVNELVLLFQLDKYFPGRMNRLYDLINIIKEKIAGCEALTLGPVVVTEI